MKKQRNNKGQFVKKGYKEELVKVKVKKLDLYQKSMLIGFAVLVVISIKGGF